jgi:hypothetical protein
MSFDPELFVLAQKQTEWHRSQVQGFLYGPNAKNREGRHVIRDCTKPAGEQIIWSHEGTADDYDRLHAKMEWVIAVETARITLERYSVLLPQPEHSPHRKGA